ncbi:helicase-related protein [Sinorhizobium sp. BG8]|uniref:helicase-related protein n=1 Tax=Sinorhizobium sp. BG8 TaxID=2613773 RepID=UPI00193CFAF2|nr:helicase-related protein [Sinorhizobium sp. BG8]
MTFLASRMGGARRTLEADPIELSSRVPSRGLPEYLTQLGVGLVQGLNDPFGPQPRDSVLASNMISVGVDVPRLGLMLVNGQPKSTAEYIQASSRVGRGLDGLVLTLYNFGRPRDVSHFEHFLTYHGALYRSVEATSVTPWAPRARDKALHAVFASAVRHLASGMQYDPDAKAFDPSTQEVKRILRELQERARSCSGEIEGDETAEDLEAIAREWAQRSRDARSSRQDLLYWEIKAPFGATRPHLMTSAEEGGRPGRLAWPTPNSMREVEPSTAFALRLIRKS